MQQRKSIKYIISNYLKVFYNIYYLIIFPIFLILSSNVSCVLWINKKIYKYRLPTLDSGCCCFSPKRNKMRYTGITLTTPLSGLFTEGRKIRSGCLEKIPNGPLMSNIYKSSFFHYFQNDKYNFWRELMSGILEIYHNLLDFVEVIAPLSSFLSHRISFINYVFENNIRELRNRLLAWFLWELPLYSSD